MSKAEPKSTTVTVIDSTSPGLPRKWKLIDYLLGRPLAANQQEEELIGPITGVPVLGLDALGSAAYGPEAALTLLLPLGALGLVQVVPISLTIIVLLLIVYFSYRQTIAAYPNGGGSYTVAKENLGTLSALLAGAALVLDYLLNVAVGISAGVGALVSAFPSLLPHMLALCLGILALLTLINLRGTRESSLALLLPTGLFVCTLCGVVVLGGARTLLAWGHPLAVAAPAVLHPATQASSAWLILRAFASGCTAMTGVEAVSNGVPLFRAPTVPNAQRALTLIIAILVVLLGGIALLVRAYGIGATEPGASGYQSVLSQLAAAVVGRGYFYYATMGSVVAVLALSANTSFADFPRLCRVLANDRFLPDAFAVRGRRLVFSHGVIVLAVLAGLLLIVFGGVTDRLIPLFAIGAFLAFTMSQAGMVAHWRKLGAAKHRYSLWVNAIGAAATGITTLVVVVSKFGEGAWLAVLVIALLVLTFSRISRHYASVAAEVADDRPLDFAARSPPIVVVPMQTWNKLSRRALRFGLDLSPEVHALCILNQDTTISDLTIAWEELVSGPARAAGQDPPRLILRKSSYRQFFAPLVNYVLRLRDEHPERNVVVIVPDLVVGHWYHAILHNHRGTLLRGLLRLRGGSRVIVVNVPFQLGGG